MKHFGTQFPFWLRVHAYALWFFLDIKIIQMLFLHTAQTTGTTRLQTDRVSLAVLVQNIDLSPAVSWAPLWEPLRGAGKALPPYLSFLRGPYSSNATCVCLSLCFTLHYTALYIYNVSIYLPEGKDIFLLNNINKIRVHIMIWLIYT